MTEKKDELQEKLNFLKNTQTNVTLSNNQIGRVKPQTIVLKKHYRYSIKG